ncbi:MAG: hypothetical protein P8M19_01125 [Crocinitomicaceae bacterium]|nr:hypothetical protein [Crocinitomicaceae bacterium]MDG2440245.1 hypothetical protein [Crocinitomicaceae bacterium]
MRYLITIVLLLLVGSQSYSQCASPTTMLFEDFEGAAPVIISIPGTTYGSVWSLKWAVRPIRSLYLGSTYQESIQRRDSCL